MVVVVLVVVIGASFESDAKLRFNERSMRFRR
jgi:hypothetical protein